nr:hypothetical protein [Providencia rettgeri]ELR5195411.1 hypothetical protein [Providencia rettgeri]
MNNEILEYAKELKKRSEILISVEPETNDDKAEWDEALNHWDVLIDPRLLIKLCNLLESSIKINDDNNKLIEAFCADDADWHKLVDKKNKESSQMVNLIMKLVNNLHEMQSKLERINNLQPVGYITSSGVDNIKEYGFTHVNEESSDIINIPLYQLD